MIVPSLQKKAAAYLLIGLLVLLLAACQAQNNSIRGTGPEQPTASPDVSTELPPDAVLNAKIWLNEQIGVPVGEIAIQEVDQAEWPDACLGLAQADEMCAQVITPGWRAVFDVNGQEYVVRTDETGEIVRMEEPAGTPEAE